MQIVAHARADALYIIFSEARPDRTRFFDENKATFVDLGRDGRLLGISVLFPRRDWRPQLTRILDDHPVGAADASELRMLAAEHRSR